MVRLSSREKWLKVGYELFCDEAHEGIQVERLARILGLNKSGFYFYFKNQENFLKELMKFHLLRIESISIEIALAKKFDPDFLNILTQHGDFLLFQMQLSKHSDLKLFSHTFNQVTGKFDQLILPLWADYLGLSTNRALAAQYYKIVRDMFYMRLRKNKMTYEHLNSILADSKMLIDKLIKTSASQ